MGFRSDPGEPFGRLSDAEASLQRLAAGPPAPPGSEETDFPALDVFETAGELVVEAELPGIDPTQVGVSIGEGMIVIEGFKEDPGPGRVNYLCMERIFGPFRRMVPTGRAVDPARAVATYREGVLQVRLPKLEEKRGGRRVIPIQADPGPAERGEP